MILGARTVIRRRYAPVTRDGSGRSVQPAPTDTTISASIQPLSGDDLAQLPEGERTKRHRKAYTTADLRTADQHTGTPADRIVDGDDVYEVQAVDLLDAVLPHYKAQLVALQETA